METIKKISAALIALTVACGMMAGCGDDSSSDKKDKDKETTTTTTAAEEKDESAEGGDDAESEAESEGGDDAADDLADITPDPDYKHNYEFAGYDAFLMFADNPNWFWSNFNGEGHVHAADFDESDSQSYGYGVDADITGDGEYTVSLTKDSIYSSGNGYINAQALVDEDNGTIFPSQGISVFCVDIIGLMDGSEVSGLDDNGQWVNTPVEADKNKLGEGDNHWDVEAVGDYKPSDIKVKVTSIKCDGEEIEFDESKIRYGNIEDNNNRYRIEIYNSYGTTAADSPLGEDAPIGFTFNKSLEVTFTIEGLGDIKQFPEVAPFGGDAAATGDAAASGDSAAEESAAADETAAETEAPAEDAAAEETTAAAE